MCTLHISQRAIVPCTYVTAWRTSLLLKGRAMSAELCQTQVSPWQNCYYLKSDNKGKRQPWQYMWEPLSSVWTWITKQQQKMCQSFCGIFAITDAAVPPTGTGVDAPIEGCFYFFLIYIFFILTKQKESRIDVPGYLTLCKSLLHNNHP